MAVVTVKSAQITARDATPRTATLGRVSGAPVQHCRDTAAITNGDSTGSKYLFFQIPSNAIPVSVRVNSPDIGTTTTADIGLYRNTLDGGTVVDADFFTAAKVLNAGAIAKSESVQGNVATIANFNKSIWELLGLTKDPGLIYDVVLTLVGAADGTGTVGLELDYTV